MDDAKFNLLTQELLSIRRLGTQPELCRDGGPADCR